MLETIHQCKLVKAYQDACIEDKDAEKSLSKPLRRRTANKKRMKICQLISRGKRLTQPKHTQVKPLSPPSRQSSIAILHSTLGRSELTLGKNCRKTGQLFTICQHLRCSTHWEASQVMDLLYGVFPATPAVFIPMWCDGNTKVLHQQWAEETK